MRDFPGSPVVKTSCFNSRGYSTSGDVGLIPGQRTKIPHAVWQSQKKNFFKAKFKKKKKKIQTVKCISIALRGCYLCRYKKEKEVKPRLGRDDNS